MEARYSHTSHIQNSPKQKLLLIFGGVVLATKPASDLAIVSMETWTLLRRVKLDQGVLQNPSPFLGHTSHVTRTTVDSGTVLEVLVVGGGSNNSSVFGPSFTQSPLKIQIDTNKYLEKS